MVGLSVHNPRIIEIAEEEDWDIDYYMTALYYLQGAREEFEQKFGHQPLSEIYLREHRDRMCGIIRSTDKPCIAFKVLAAGRAINSKNQNREKNLPLPLKISNPMMFFWWGCIKNSTTSSAKTRR